jgi:hypothetical protein
LILASSIPVPTYNCAQVDIFDDLSVFLIIRLLFREGLTFFDASSEPLKKELSRGKFTILPSKVSSYRPSEVCPSRLAFIYKYLVRKYYHIPVPGYQNAKYVKIELQIVLPMI